MKGSYLSNVMGVKCDNCDSAGEKSQEPLTSPACFCRDSLYIHPSRIELYFRDIE